MSQLAERWATNQFNFSNDVLDPPYLKRFSEAVNASRKKFVWNTDLRAEKAFTSELCHRMADAGLNSAAIGSKAPVRKRLTQWTRAREVHTLRQVGQRPLRRRYCYPGNGIFRFPGRD